MIQGNFPDLVREQSYPTPFQNSTFLPLLLLSLASQKHTPDTKSSFSSEYDYIIIGAGTAGSVVANRLSEIDSVKVLLLEAGPSPPLLTDLPVISGAFGNSEIDWHYFTEPQEYTARVQTNKQLPWPSGKTLGGSSTINSMLYIRGSYEIYDEWGAQGCEDWNSKEVLKYFMRAEDNRDPEYISNGYHGVGGPMTVETVKKDNMLLSALLKSQERLGYPLVDPNGPKQLGIAAYQGNLRNGQRCSTAKGYLVPAENRTNLDIITEAFVTKILTKGKRAYGVSFDYHGNSYDVKAKREVILSAGTVNSAQLLMLSGIGPKQTLKKLGIPVVADLPVGSNFHNHGGPLLFFTIGNNIPSFSSRVQNRDNILRYINSKTGLLATTKTILAITFLKVNPEDPPSSAPDLELYFKEAKGMRGTLNVPDQVYEQVYGPYENRTNMFCFPQTVRPRSRGYVSIRSSNPYDMPLINPNYLEDPLDVEDLVTGLKECFRIIESPEMKRLGVKPFDTLIPGCEDVSDDIDLYFECSVRSIFVGASHAVGTCKMGNLADRSTVVDSKLRVKGIQGLRVVDASVMPVIPTGNTNNVVIMIAEKASDIIKSLI